jgi:hypothetical protein
LESSLSHIVDAVKWWKSLIEENEWSICIKTSDGSSERFSLKFDGPTNCSNY